MGPIGQPLSEVQRAQDKTEYDIYFGGAPIAVNPVAESDFVLRASRTIGVLWSQQSSLSATTNLYWRSTDLNFVQKENVLRWNARTTVKNTSGYIWLARNTVEQNLLANWNVGSLVRQTVSSQWNNMQSVQKSLDMYWRSTDTSPIHNLLQMFWNVGEAPSGVKNTIGLQWNTISSVRKQAFMRWSVGETMQKTLNLNWQTHSDYAPPVADTNFSMAAGYTLDVLFDKPIAYWLLRGTGIQIADRSGNNYAATVTGTPRQSMPPIVSGGEFSTRFDTAYATATLGESVLRRGAENQSFAFEVWLRGAPNARTVVMGRPNSGIIVTPTGIGIRLETTSGVREMVYPVVWGGPMHAVLTYQQRQAMLFINAKAVGSIELDDDELFNEATNDFIIGRYSGYMEEAAVYRSLAPARIIDHYLRGIRVQNYNEYILQRVPQALWVFDDDHAGTIQVIEDDTIVTTDPVLLPEIINEPAFVAGNTGQALLLNNGNYVRITL